MHLDKTIFRFLVIGSLIAASVLSCSKNDNGSPDYNADKTVLKSLIDSLQSVSDTSSEGNKPGQYVTGAKTALDSVINLAKDVFSANTYTQEQVNNAISNLRRAAVTFSSKRLKEVSPENLMGYWKFNGNANDSSGNHNDGEFKTNWFNVVSGTPVDGGTMPTLVSDRFGNENAACYFEKGATVEVPYKNSLNPKNITITLWLKTDAISGGGDYIFALRRWFGYKLNLQTSNFLYFTVYKGDNNWVMDDDGGSGSTVPLGTWVFAAVSYDNSTNTGKFYLNGALVKTLTNKTGPPATLTTPYNLTIGNEMPKSKYNITDSNDPDYYYGPDNFTGTLDDVRLYNTALADNEVLSIYTSESTQ